MVANGLVTVELMADVGEDTTSSLGVDSESEIETESEVETEPEAGATPSVGTELLLSAEPAVDPELSFGAESSVGADEPAGGVIVGDGTAAASEGGRVSSKCFNCSKAWFIAASVGKSIFTLEAVFIPLPPKGRAPNPLAALELEIELEFKSGVELADGLFACCTDTGLLGGTVKED